MLRIGARPAGNHRRRPAPAGDAGLLTGVSVRPPAVVRTGQQDQGTDAGGAGLRVLHRLRIGSGGHLAENGARLLARQRPAGKTCFIGREKGYHGVNFGGISVGGIAGNRNVRRRRRSGPPAAHPAGRQRLFARHAATGAELAEELNRIIALRDASTIAAVIVEPFSGSAGDRAAGRLPAAPARNLYPA